MRVPSLIKNKHLVYSRNRLIMESSDENDTQENSPDVAGAMQQQ